MPDEVYKQLKVKCVYENISVTDYVLNLVKTSLSQPVEKGSVLVVEDENILRDSLKDWLKDNYNVTTAVDGNEALELIQEQDFDVLIVDVRLPGKNGIQVLREAREIRPQIQSIIITAYPSVELAVEAMKLGAVDYLIKPIEPNKLERLVLGMLTKAKSSK